MYITRNVRITGKIYSHAWFLNDVYVNRPLLVVVPGRPRQVLRRQFQWSAAERGQQIRCARTQAGIGLCPITVFRVRQTETRVRQ